MKILNIKSIDEEELEFVFNPEMNWYETEIFVNQKKVKISINPEDLSDEEDIAEILELTKKVLKDFQAYESKAREKIIEEFLDTYNESWADEEEGYPILTKEQFNEKLTLQDIGFSSEQMVEFYYDDGDMFGGHSLIAISFDGENFDDANMFG